MVAGMISALDDAKRLEENVCRGCMQDGIASPRSEPVFFLKVRHFFKATTAALR